MECSLCKTIFDTIYKLNRHLDGKKACISTKNVIEIFEENKRLIEENKRLKTINGNYNKIINGNENTLGDNNTIKSNNTNIVQVIINNYNDPSIDEIEDCLIKNLFITWDELIFQKFKCIYTNKDKPENQSIYAPRVDRNIIKIVKDGKIRENTINDIIEEIEEIIIEKCEHAVVGSNKKDDEKNKLLKAIDKKYVDIQRSRDFYNEIPFDVYKELNEKRIKMIQRIKKVLFNNKEDLEIRKQEIKKQFKT